MPHVTISSTIHGRPFERMTELRHWPMYLDQWFACASVQSRRPNRYVWHNYGNNFYVSSILRFYYVFQLAYSKVHITVFSSFLFIGVVDFREVLFKLTYRQSWNILRTTSICPRSSQHLTCLVRTGMTVLRWYYLSQSFFTIAELRADLKNLYGRDADTRQPYISNAVSLHTGSLSAKRSLQSGDYGPCHTLLFHLEYLP